MNIFKILFLYNKIQKAIKKSKKIIDAKKGIAEEIKKHIDNIEGELQAIAVHLPDFRNLFSEIKKVFIK
jgi:hypothetical protein